MIPTVPNNKPAHLSRIEKRGHELISEVLMEIARLQLHVSQLTNSFELLQLELAERIDSNGSGKESA